MSQENVEIVRRIFEAVARRDAESTLALYDPEVEIDNVSGFLTGMAQRLYSGHDGLRAFNRELREAFEDVETNCEELIDAGERVVSASQYRARGRGSGIEIDGPVQFGVWTIREGKIARVAWFDSREDALEAAGLRE